MPREAVVPARSTASGCSALRIYDFPFSGLCMTLPFKGGTELCAKVA